MTGRGGAWSRHKLSEEEAVARLAAHGYEPLEPYPTSRRPWRIRCLTCRQPRHMLMGNLKTPCSHVPVGEGKRGRPLPESQAQTEIRAAGWEPLEPYPGTPRAAWRCAPAWSAPGAASAAPTAAEDPHPPPPEQEHDDDHMATRRPCPRG